MTMLDAGEKCFCGKPATRTLAAVPYCDGCAETVLAPIVAAHPASRLHNALKSWSTRSDPGDACDVPGSDTTTGA